MIFNVSERLGRVGFDFSIIVIGDFLRYRYPLPIDIIRKIVMPIMTNEFALLVFGSKGTGCVLVVDWEVSGVDCWTLVSIEIYRIIFFPNILK